MINENKVKLSLVIVTYNNGQELEDCLTSIREYNDIGDRLEVIVADNSSTEKVKEIVSRHKEVYYISNPDNGFGKGNNVGFSISTGDLIIFLNPDTEIIEPSFQKIIDHYYSVDKCGMAGVKLLNVDGVEHNSYNMCLNLGLSKKIILFCCRKFNIFLPNCMYTSGADIIMDRDTFIKIGKFDENIFMFGEEQDLAYRVIQKGKRLNYFADIKMVHLQGKSTQKNYSSTHGRMLESNRIYCNKYGFDFNKEVKKEIFAMKTINAILKLFGKRKYDEELIKFYVSYLSK